MRIPHAAPGRLESPSDQGSVEGHLRRFELPHQILFAAGERIKRHPARQLIAGWRIGSEQIGREEVALPRQDRHGGFSETALRILQSARNNRRIIRPPARGSHASCRRCNSPGSRPVLLVASPRKPQGGSPRDGALPAAAPIEFRSRPEFPRAARVRIR